MNNATNNQIALSPTIPLNNATKYFIPEVSIINGIQVPSIPYKTSDNKALFMGDIIEVAFHNDGAITRECYLVDTRDGQYTAVAKNEDSNTPLWCLVGEQDECMTITNIGSSVANPELLAKIK